MNNICLGILAHVDAGKTSLCEGLLYKTKSIRAYGRVDNKDSFLDIDEIEKKRGITIYSKTANIKLDKLNIQLVDTPGHIDFSIEMQRTLSILDYAILVISSIDGIQGYTKKLFELLKKNKLPCFIFLNKLDISRKNKKDLLIDIDKKLSTISDGHFIDFSNQNKNELYEEISLSDEKLLNEYLEKGEINKENIKKLIKERLIFPVYFGSATKDIGIDNLIEGLENYTLNNEYEHELSGIVYKIDRDEKGVRLSHIKLSGGSLKPKQILNDEKINQIRIYNGEKYETVQELKAGQIGVISGLNKTYVGQTFGSKNKVNKLENILNYKICLNEGEDIKSAYLKLRTLNDENPEFNISYDERNKNLSINLMGEVQLEVLKAKIKERFELFVEFKDAQVIYKESIIDEVLGLGHFEPLKHFAEVHLLIKPGEKSSGIKIVSKLRQDVNKSIENSIIEYLQVDKLKGIVCGFEITDLEIEILKVKLHNKHTQGGDLREATYRAFRQGLMYAKGVILEPYYDFYLTLPSQNLGRALNDLNNMNAKFDSPNIENEIAYIKGYAPFVNIQNYSMVLASYTKAQASLNISFRSYDRCHNMQEILEKNAYNPNFDAENPSYSIFCDKGETFIVEWDKVHEYIHLDIEDDFYKQEIEELEIEKIKKINSAVEKDDTKELMEIFERTYGKIKNRVAQYNKIVENKIREKEYSFKPVKKEKECILVDGYNVIFAWDELKELVKINITSARDRLIDILSAYQASIDSKIILVFDAYKLSNHKTETFKINNIYVVYTKTAETADQYIEKNIKDISKKYKVTVVSSDGLEQITVRSSSCLIMSSREFYYEVKRVNENILNDYNINNESGKSYLSENISNSIKEAVKNK